MNPDYLKQYRAERAIKANAKFGGKIFCLHDWTQVGSYIDSNKIPYMCVKCGLERIMTASMSSDYVENLLN